eukprot:3313418-Rhodomonas_salina.1
MTVCCERMCYEHLDGTPTPIKKRGRVPEKRKQEQEVAVNKKMTVHQTMYANSVPAYVRPTACHVRAQ